MSIAHALPAFAAVDSRPTEGVLLVEAGVTRWANRCTRRPLVAG